MGRPAGDPRVDTAPVYVISVAAQLSGLHPQTLRQYDRLGLVSPVRAPGRGRRYSVRDVARLRVVQELTAAGVNLAGVKRILELEQTVSTLSHRMAELEDRLAARDPRAPAHTGASEDLRRTPAVNSPVAPPRRTSNLPVPLPVQGSTALVLWRRKGRLR